MFFIFAGGECSVCTGAVLEYFPGGWVRELHVVHNAHLFILQFHTSSFRTSWWGDMTLLFFSEWCVVGKISMGYRSRMSQSFILIDALSSACWEKEKKKEKKNG
jgi:hypothetical protein